jgi:single-strand DNA-binding protein
MPSSARVILVGHLAADPEKRFLSDGRPMVNIRVPVNDDRKTDHTSWYRVTIFGRDAEFVAERATKGQLVQVIGRLTTGIYEGDKGAKVNLDVVADTVLLLGPAGDKSAAHMAEMGATIYPETQDVVGFRTETNDELPF